LLAPLRRWLRKILGGISRAAGCGCPEPGLERHTGLEANGSERGTRPQGITTTSIIIIRTTAMMRAKSSGTKMGMRNKMTTMKMKTTTSW